MALAVADPGAGAELPAPKIDVNAALNRRQRRSAQQAAAKADAKAKAKAKGKGAKDKSKKCFASTCEKVPKAHSKFCVDHHKDAEALRYQGKQRAKEDPEAFEAVERALADPDKAHVALEDMRRSNPTGRFRKRLVEWSAFKQRFGKRAETRIRGEEEGMDMSDYVEWQKRRGKTDEEAMASWKALLARPDIDREGEGADTKVWIQKNRKRMRDVIYYKDAEVEDGSRATKDMSSADRSGSWALAF